MDAGVGGRVAVEIGRRLARLARHSQVVVVTHLAQVAAFADRHYVVVKSDDGQVTTSGVQLVADEQRAAELARMMAGLETTESALAHAGELVELAAATRPELTWTRPVRHQPVHRLGLGEEVVVTGGHRACCSRPACCTGAALPWWRPGQRGRRWLGDRGQVVGCNGTDFFRVGPGPADLDRCRSTGASQQVWRVETRRRRELVPGQCACRPHRLTPGRMEAR